MSNIKVDPKIKINTLPDGEIHIVFTWNLGDLEQMARAFLAVSDGRMKAEDALMVFRLRNKEGVDYLIQELQKARDALWG